MNVFNELTLVEKLLKFSKFHLRKFLNKSLNSFESHARNVTSPFALVVTAIDLFSFEIKFVVKKIIQIIFIK